MPESEPPPGGVPGAPGGAPGSGGEGGRTMSVRQVNELVRGALQRHIPATLHVVGEIGDLSRPASGHLYFTLKDAASELRCVMWRSAAASLKFQPTAGLDVIATGALEVYVPRGTYQLLVRRLEPRGVGALELAFRQLREKLAHEGLFDAARKKPLPPFPQRVALVTSPSGAAIRDILQTLRRRFPLIEVLLFPVRVQGAGAAADIAAAIAGLNRWSGALGGIDVAIVARGGGSLEELWAFNEEVVARAVAASRVPIVSGVGHEVDVTICDLVADLRAPTPTAAAELIAPRIADLYEHLDRARGRGGRAMRHALALAEAEFQRIAAAPPLARPLSLLQERAQRLDELSQRFRIELGERFRRARERLTRAQMVVLRYGTGAEFARVRQRLERTLFVLRQGLAEQVVRDERRVAARAAALERCAPGGLVQRCDEHLEQAARRMRQALRERIARLRLELANRMDAVTSRDPRRVLQRGYSITRDARSGKVLRSSAEVREGQKLLTQLAEGEVRSTAEDPRQPHLF